MLFSHDLEYHLTKIAAHNEKLLQATTKLGIQLHGQSHIGQRTCQKNSVVSLTYTLLVYNVP